MSISFEDPVTKIDVEVVESIPLAKGIKRISEFSNKHDLKLKEEERLKEENIKKAQDQIESKLESIVSDIINFINNNIKKGSCTSSTILDINLLGQIDHLDQLDTKIFKDIANELYKRGIFSYNFKWSLIRDYDYANISIIWMKILLKYNLIWSTKIKINGIYPIREYENFFTYDEVYEKIFPSNPKSNIKSYLKKPKNNIEANKNWELYLRSRGFR